MHRDQASPSTSRARSDARYYRAATRLVRGWAGLYIRGVPLHYAQRRLSQVDFELWEHADATDRRCWRALPGALGLVLHVLAGVRLDLRWRRSIRVGRAVHQSSPRSLVPMRHRRRVTVPLQVGRLFDQTNGLIAPPEARPHRRGRMWFGSLGGAIGTNGR